MGDGYERLPERLSMSLGQGTDVKSRVRATARAGRDAKAPASQITPCRDSRKNGQTAHGWAKPVEVSKSADLDAAVKESDPEKSDQEIEELRAELANLQRQNKRLREHSAARLRKEARASAEAVGEIESELDAVKAALSAAQREIVALRESALADRAAAADASARAAASSAENARKAPEPVKGEADLQFRQTELSARLDAALLVEERNRRAQLQMELTEARRTQALQQEQIRLYSETIAGLKAKHDALGRDRDRAYELLHEIQKNYEGSTSWRLTDPIRQIKKLFQTG